MQAQQYSQTAAPAAAASNAYAAAAQQPAGTYAQQQQQPAQPNAGGFVPQGAASAGYSARPAAAAAGYGAQAAGGSGGYSAGASGARPVEASQGTRGGAGGQVCVCASDGLRSPVHGTGLVFGRHLQAQGSHVAAHASEQGISLAIQRQLLTGVFVCGCFTKRVSAVCRTCCADWSGRLRPAAARCHRRVHGCKVRSRGNRIHRCEARCHSRVRRRQARRSRRIHCRPACPNCWQQCRVPGQLQGKQLCRPSCPDVPMSI